MIANPGTKHNPILAGGNPLVCVHCDSTTDKRGIVGYEGRDYQLYLCPVCDLLQSKEVA